jgi:3-dehydroquinate dehydratase
MKSVTIEAAQGAVFGFGMRGYQIGLDALLGHLDKTA